MGVKEEKIEALKREIARLDASNKKLKKRIPQLFLGALIFAIINPLLFINESTLFGGTTYEAKALGSFIFIVLFSIICYFAVSNMNNKKIDSYRKMIKRLED